MKAVACYLPTPCTALVAAENTEVKRRRHRVLFHSHPTYALKSTKIPASTKAPNATKIPNSTKAPNSTKIPVSTKASSLNRGSYIDNHDSYTNHGSYSLNRQER